MIDGSPSSPLDPLRLLWAMLKLPRGTPVFCPGYNAPLFVVRPFVFTIHDLNHIDRSENSNFLKRLYYRLIMRRACRKAFRILTVSEFSRQRIIEWAGIDANRVVNMGNGVGQDYHPDVTPYDPGFRYLLHVGNRKAHKNDSRVMRAFARANIDPDIRLMFTGHANKALLLLSKRLGVEKRVVFVGRVPEEDLPHLYRGALALVFPSLYEGFGLPVIEAMACGTPVLTSNTTSLPEVAGGAALLVDPLSVEQIIEGVERLCTDDILRESMRQRGLRWAAQMTWDDSAAKVEAVFDELKKKMER